MWIKASLGKLKFPRSISEYYEALVEHFALKPLSRRAARTPDIDACGDRERRLTLLSELPRGEGVPE
jgi:hypothetical protein